MLGRGQLKPPRRAPALSGRLDVPLSTEEFSREGGGLGQSGWAAASRPPDTNSSKMFGVPIIQSPSALLGLPRPSNFAQMGLITSADEYYKRRAWGREVGLRHLGPQPQLVPTLVRLFSPHKPWTAPVHQQMPPLSPTAAFLSPQEDTEGV